MEFMEVIKKRRSIRRFKDKKVPEEDIEAMLDAASLAPSGGNEQNWLFGVVRDKDEISEIAEAAGGQEWIATAPLVFALCTELKKDLKGMDEDEFELQVDKERFGEDFIEYLREFPDQRKVAMLFENCNTLIPGEHIFLTAVSRGLSACWIGYLDIEKVSSILKLPDGYVCLFLMPVGYPDEEPKDLDKKDKEEMVFYDTYR